MRRSPGEFLQRNGKESVKSVASSRALRAAFGTRLWVAQIRNVLDHTIKSRVDNSVGGLTGISSAGTTETTKDRTLLGRS